MSDLNPYSEEEEEGESASGEESFSENTQNTILTADSLSFYEVLESYIYNMTYARAITQKGVNLT